MVRKGGAILEKIHRSNLFGMVLLLGGFLLLLYSFINAVGPSWGFQLWLYCFFMGFLLMVVGLFLSLFGSRIATRFMHMKRTSKIITGVIIFFSLVILNIGFISLSIVNAPFWYATQDLTLEQDDSQGTLTVVSVTDVEDVLWDDFEIKCYNESTMQYMSSDAVLPSGTVTLGDVITNCTGVVGLLYTPANSIVGEWISHDENSFIYRKMYVHLVRGKNNIFLSDDFYSPFISIYSNRVPILYILNIDLIYTRYTGENYTSCYNRLSFSVDNSFWCHTVFL